MLFTASVYSLSGSPPAYMTCLSTFPTIAISRILSFKSKKANFLYWLTLSQYILSASFLRSSEAAPSMANTTTLSPKSLADLMNSRGIAPPPAISPIFFMFYFRSTMANIKSASHTILPSTEALPCVSIMVSRTRFVISTLRRSWSPGTTGFLNLALFIVMK